MNYATFGDGVGALGGGNISLVAGKDIIGIAASLPETLAVSGGVTASAPPVAHYYGGGDLLVQAGGNVDSASFLVGRGAGLIQAGGSIGADPGNSASLPLLLAVQDGFVSAIARSPRRSARSMIRPRCPWLEQLSRPSWTCRTAPFLLAPLVTNQHLTHFGSQVFHDLWSAKRHRFEQHQRRCRGARPRREFYCFADRVLWRQQRSVYYRFAFAGDARSDCL